MRDDDYVSNIWCGMILGASLGWFVASLRSVKPERHRQLDEAWLMSLREQGW